MKIFLLFYIPDINECLLQNGGCSQKCVNEYQSFHCACNNGFQLGSDGKHCDGEYIYIYIPLILIQSIKDIVILHFLGCFLREKRTNK